MRHVWLLGLLVGCAASPPAPSPTPVATRSPMAVVIETPTPTPTVDVPRLIQDGQDQVLLGKPREALAALAPAALAEPDNEEVHYWMMMAYQKAEQSAEAMREAQMVIKLAPDSAHAEEAKTLVSLTAAPAVKGDGKRPQDVKGFEKVKLGMTEAEVRKIYGGELQPFKGQYSNPGKRVPFSCMRKFGVQSLEVLFPFSEETGRLVGVYIRPKNYPSGSRREYDQLLATLTGVYGPPDRDESLDAGMVDRLRKSWDFTSARVHLNLYNGGDLSITILPP